MKTRILFISFLLLLLAGCRKDIIIQKPEGPGTEQPQEDTVQTEDPVIETGLPVVYINTDGARAIKSKTVEVPATIKVKGAGGYADQMPLKCSVRGRGNTTWSWPKKPYLVKLKEAAPMLGMPSHKRWVLLANFMDRTMMRNLVSMKVSSLTSLAWTPRCVPVELVLNGRHVGNYLLIEQVRVSSERVNISKDNGFLLELDFHYDNEFQWIDSHGSCDWRKLGIPFGVKHPDAEDLSEDRKIFIKSHINKVASCIYGEGFADPEEGYAKWIDVDSFIDYWLVFEIMGNHELRNPGSVFMYMEEGGKLMAGPCWDFDWGVLSYNTSPGARSGLVNEHAIWYDRLLQDPAFRQKLRERFLELLPALETIPQQIEAWRALLSESARLNFAMWNPAQDASQNQGKIINGDERMTFDEAVTLLSQIYQERLVVLRNVL